MTSPNSSDENITITPTEFNKAALVVGVNNSIHSTHRRPSLQYAENDAYDIAWTLQQPASNFIFLTPTPTLSGKDAQSMIIRDAITEFVHKRTSKDFLLFYFSGHAQPMRTKDDQEDIYLVSSDFKEEQVEIDPTRHLSMRWLREVLYQQNNLGGVLLILDCCYAGNIVNAVPDALQINLRKLFHEYFQDTDDPKPKDRLRLILMASGYDTVAHEKEGHGVMTALLLSALRGEVEEVLDDDGRINFLYLYKYLQDKMPPEQRPNMFGEFAAHCILAHHPEKAKHLRRATQKAEEEAQKARENERWEEFSKFMGKMSKLIDDPNYWKHSQADSFQSFDYALCREASLADLDMEKISEFFKQDRLLKQKQLPSGTSVQDRLTQFGFVKDLSPTYGALLCFGKNPQEWVSSSITRCTNWNSDDRLQDSEIFQSDLLSQFMASRDFLRRCLRLTRVISRQDSTESWEIPFRVLEEALANALVHREYTNPTGFIQVQVFDDRVEICSPGGPPPPMTIEMLGTETTSHPRNLQIAIIFYLYGYIEQVGSGIKRMRSFMQEAGLQAPYFELSPLNTFKVALYRPPRYEQASDRKGQTLGHYRLTQLLARGSSADIYLGNHISLKNQGQVAIKIFQTRLASDERKDFIDEVSDLSRLTHHNIIKIQDFFVYDDMPIIVMKYTPHGSLQARIRGLALPLNTVVVYVKQIAQALQYAHNQNRLHRNLKPENLLIGLDGEVLLTSFSMEQISRSRKNDASQGTVAYMAPEQFLGKPTPASDQYALGIIVYEWLSGTRPFKGTYDEIVAQHKEQLPTPLQEITPTVPPEVGEVVMTALAKNPEERFQDIQTFADALEHAGQAPRPHSTITPLIGERWDNQGYTPINTAQITSPLLLPTRQPNEFVATFPKLISPLSILFELDTGFLTAKKYRLFRQLGMLLNFLSAIILGSSLNSIWIGSVGLIASLTIFTICILLVRRNVATFFAAMLALYWGIVGSLLVLIILAIFFLVMHTNQQITSFLYIIALLITFIFCTITAWRTLYTYISTKNLL